MERKAQLFKKQRTYLIKWWRKSCVFQSMRRKLQLAKSESMLSSSNSFSVKHALCRAAVELFYFFPFLNYAKITPCTITILSFLSKPYTYKVMWALWSNLSFKFICMCMWKTADFYLATGHARFALNASRFSLIIGSSLHAMVNILLILHNLKFFISKFKTPHQTNLRKYLRNYTKHPYREGVHVMWLLTINTVFCGRM